MIIPSVIGKTFDEVKQKITQLEDLVGWAQLDIMDGRFVLPTSWDVAEDLENVEGKIKLEAHLMIEEPEDSLKLWINYVDRVFVHVESTSNLAAILDAVEGSPNKFGVAIKMDTPLDVLEEAKDKITHLQLMSIDVLGHYGAKFDEAIYDRIGEVKRNYPNVQINVDGGINLANAPKLLAAGADNLVVGSAIWKEENIAETIKDFEALS